MIRSMSETWHKDLFSDERDRKSVWEKKPLVWEEDIELYSKFLDRKVAIHDQKQIYSSRKFNDLKDRNQNILYQQQGSSVYHYCLLCSQCVRQSFKSGMLFSTLPLQQPCITPWCIAEYLLAVILAVLPATDVGLLGKCCSSNLQSCWISQLSHLACFIDGERYLLKRGLVGKSESSC